MGFPVKDRLAGLVVKASAMGAGDPGFDPRFHDGVLHFIGYLILDHLLDNS